MSSWYEMKLSMSVLQKKTNIKQYLHLVWDLTVNYHSPLVSSTHTCLYSLLNTFTIPIGDLFPLKILKCTSLITIHNKTLSLLWVNLLFKEPLIILKILKMSWIHFMIVNQATCVYFRMYFPQVAFSQHLQICVAFQRSAKGNSWKKKNIIWEQNVIFKQLLKKCNNLCFSIRLPITLCSISELSICTV